MSLILDPVGDLGEWPGVQALVEMVAVVDFLADVGQVTDGDGVHPGLIASLHEMLADQVEQMVDLAGFPALDLVETFGFAPVFHCWRFDLGAHLLPSTPDRLAVFHVHDQMGFHPILLIVDHQDADNFAKWYPRAVL